MAWRKGGIILNNPPKLSTKSIEGLKEKVLAKGLIWEEFGEV